MICDSLTAGKVHLSVFEGKKSAFRGQPVFLPRHIQVRAPMEIFREEEDA
jgi:hypothetical protein